MAEARTELFGSIDPHDLDWNNIPSDGLRRLTAILARMYRPSMPPPVLVDPVASYLVRHYGVPSRSTT